MKIVNMTLFKGKDKYMVSSQEGICVETCNSYVFAQKKYIDI
jgi:hypothetical protein